MHKDSYKAQKLSKVDGNILVSIQPHKNNKSSGKFHEESFYIPEKYTISHLRAFLNQKIFEDSNRQQKSYFLFAYGSVLNNHERIGQIYQKFQHKVDDNENGLQIKYAEMSSFG